jgi:hypothetical protein
MMNNSIHKILILSIIGIDTILVILTEPSLFFLNKGLFHVYEESIIEPLFYGLASLLFSIVFLLFFSSFYFKNWLKYIASWYIPLTVIFISQISINSSFILSIDRPTAALYWMAGLFLITVIFVFTQKNIPKK